MDGKNGAGENMSPREAQELTGKWPSCMKESVCYSTANASSTKLCFAFLYLHESITLSFGNPTFLSSSMFCRRFRDNRILGAASITAGPLSRSASPGDATAISTSVDLKLAAAFAESIVRRVKGTVDEQGNGKRRY